MICDWTSLGRAFAKWSLLTLNGLCVYVGFLIIFIVLELMVSVYVSVQRYGLEFRVSEWMCNDFFKNITDDGFEQHQKSWDDMQMTYECCGLNGPEDYPAVRKAISLSCCKRAYRARTEYAQQQLYQNCLELDCLLYSVQMWIFGGSKTYFNEGCKEEIFYTFRLPTDWLIGVTAICFWFETIAIICAMLLANKMKHNGHLDKLTARY